MRHLFIINPTSYYVKGHVEEVKAQIRTVFTSHPEMKYTIHVSRWTRDALGYTRRFVHNAGEVIRVYAVGGTGTLYEVINGVIGRPNVQVSFFPMGRTMTFVESFGKDRAHLFTALQNLVFADVIAVNAIRCGHNFGMNFAVVCGEALFGDSIEEYNGRIGFPFNFISNPASIRGILRAGSISNRFKIVMDDKVIEGDYLAVLLLCRQPYFEREDGGGDALDVYVIHKASRRHLLKAGLQFKLGGKMGPDIKSEHYTSERVEICSDEVMCVTIDGEVTYNSEIVYEFVPYALDFACPKEIYGGDMSGLGTEWIDY